MNPDNLRGRTASAGAAKVSASVHKTSQFCTVNRARQVLNRGLSDPGRPDRPSGTDLQGQIQSTALV